MTATSPFKQAVLLRNHVQVRGSGPRTLVFAHGFGCDQNMWRYVAPAFEREFRIVLFDYVGCGRSDLSAFDPVRYRSLEGYAQDLIEVCDALDLREAIFVGHSVSSMVGLLAALRQPALFSRLVMIGPSPRYINDAPDYVGGFEREDIEGLLSVMDHNFLGWAATLAPAVMGNPDRPELSGELERSFCSTDPKVAHVFARATFYADNRADLAKLQQPALIVQVRDDAIAPMAVGEYMHRHLPRSELVVLDATGHCPHMSHPAQTIAAMRPFVEAGARA
jgi:sigma-B regulation protein RsbQ